MNSSALVRVVRGIHKNLRVNLQKEKDILGTNLAGLKLIKREIKDRDLKGIESLEKLQK